MDFPPDMIVHLFCRRCNNWFMRIHISLCVAAMQQQDEKLKQVREILFGTLAAKEKRQLKIDYELQTNQLFSKCNGQLHWVIPGALAYCQGRTGRWRPFRQKFTDTGKETKKCSNRKIDNIGYNFQYADCRISFHSPSQYSASVFSICTKRTTGTSPTVSRNGFN